MNLRDYANLQRRHNQQLQFIEGQNRARQLEQMINPEPPSKAGDHIYLNVTVNHSPLVPKTLGAPYNTTILVSADEEQAEYNITKNIPILNKCSDYYASILRFSIPLDVVPLQIMSIVPNQANPNLTPYFVGISYGGTDYASQLIYIPPNNLTPPVQNLPTQIITPYYFTYNYGVLIRMINTALTAAFVASPIPAAIGGSALAPYIYLDPVTNLFTLVVQPYFTTLTAPLASVPIIYVNALLAPFIDSFQFKFIGFDSPTGHDYEFILNDYLLKPYYPPTYGLAPGVNPIIFYASTQEYSTLEYWTSIRKILVTSSSIPILNESVPTTNNTSDINALFPIISDFTLNIDQSAGTSRTIAYYLPTAEYRLVDMISDNPLQKIDLKFYWQDLQANLYPIYLSANQQIEVKLGFFRKSLYKNQQSIRG